MKAVLDRAFDTPERREALAQLVRYGVIGAAITALGQLIYYVLAEWRFTSPLVAIATAWVVGVVVGYFAHGSISFRGHGERNDHGRIGLRFVVVNLLGYLANSFWVWWLVERLVEPTWWPIIPNIVLTPLLTFLLHRHWTYG
jgi:putative flippase GtrA